LEIENKEDITVVETLSTVNRIQDKLESPPGAQTRIKTQEVALQVDNEVYIVQTTYIEVGKSPLDVSKRRPSEETPMPGIYIEPLYAISPPPSTVLPIETIEVPEIQKRTPLPSPSSPIAHLKKSNGAWALFRLVLPNHPVKRLSLLHQIEDNTPPVQTPADSSDDKNEGMSKVEELEKRIDALALDERSRALKDKEDMKRSSLKEKNALKSHGVKQEAQKKTKEKQMGKKGSR